MLTTPCWWRATSSSIPRGIRIVHLLRNVPRKSPDGIRGIAQTEQLVQVGDAECSIFAVRHQSCCRTTRAGLVYVPDRSVADGQPSIYGLQAATAVRTSGASRRDLIASLR